MPRRMLAGISLSLARRAFDSSIVRRFGHSILKLHMDMPLELYSYVTVQILKPNGLGHWDLVNFGTDSLRAMDRAYNAVLRQLAKCKGVERGWTQITVRERRRNT